MKIKEFDCPSCGASLQVKAGKKSLTCPYCDSTVIVPEELAGDSDNGWEGEPVPQVRPTVVLNTTGTGKSCSTAIVSIAVFLLIGIGAGVFWLTSSQSAQHSIGNTISSVTGGIPCVMEFGGQGMRQGYFQDARHLCVDNEGRIYVGEGDTGVIQVFDSTGTYLYQWKVGKAADIYIGGMAAWNGKVYVIYDSELFVHDAQTGELLGQLEDPDGWGFDDVAVGQDGSIVAAWYCNSDDILKFSPDGELEFVLREAISSQSGDSELDTQVAVDGAGNIFAYGSFNGSFFKFSPNGRFLNRFGSEGDHPGQFTSPASFCTDRMGRIWVSDFNDLIVFDNDGTYLATFQPGMTLEDMYMEDGYQLIGLTYDDTVVKLDLSGKVEDL